MTINRDDVSGCVEGTGRIVRVWRGRTSAASAGVYQRHVTTVVFPKLDAIAGYLGGRVLRRLAGDETEFLVVTEWASLEAIRVFAGAQLDVAVVEPAAMAVLAYSDQRVQHFEVAHDSRLSRDQAPNSCCGTHATRHHRRPLVAPKEE